MEMHMTKIHQINSGTIKQQKFLRNILHQCLKSLDILPFLGKLRI